MLLTAVIGSSVAVGAIRTDLNAVKVEVGAVKEEIKQIRHERREDAAALAAQWAAHAVQHREDTAAHTAQHREDMAAHREEIRELKHAIKDLQSDLKAEAVTRAAAGRK